MGNLNPSSAQTTIEPASSGAFTTKFEPLLHWAQKYCPPRPEAVLDGLKLRQDNIQRGDRRPAIVKPRFDPATNPNLGLVQLRRNSQA